MAVNQNSFLRQYHTFCFVNQPIQKSNDVSIVLLWEINNKEHSMRPPPQVYPDDSDRVIGNWSGTKGKVRWEDYHSNEINIFWVWIWGQ